MPLASLTAAAADRPWCPSSTAVAVPPRNVPPAPAHSIPSKVSASPGPGTSDPTDSSTAARLARPAPAVIAPHRRTRRTTGTSSGADDDAADRQRRRVQPDDGLGQPHLQPDERQHRP